MASRKAPLVLCSKFYVFYSLCSSDSGSGEREHLAFYTTIVEGESYQLQRAGISEWWVEKCLSCDDVISMIYTGFLEKQKPIPSIHPPFLLSRLDSRSQASYIPRSAVNKQGHRKAMGRDFIYAVIRLSKAREGQCPSPKSAKHRLSLCLLCLQMVV